MKKLALILVAFLFLSSFAGSSVYADDWDDWPPLEETFAVSGTVWLDLNRNGTIDGGEPGIPGISVFFFPSNPDDGLGEGSGTSDSSGNYTLTDELYAGNYMVGFEDSNKDYTKTKTHIEDGFALPGDSACGTIIKLNKDNCRVDIGLVRLFLLSGEVYEDVNGNGIRDEGEPPLAAEVKLDWGENIAINSDTTKDDSNFLFKVHMPKARLFVTPLDASYKTLSGEECYEEEIDFGSEEEITGKSYGFINKSFETIETPEPTETPLPTEIPTPMPTPEPIMPPEKTDDNKPLENVVSYEPYASSDLSNYATAEKKDESAESDKNYISTGKAFIKDSKIYYSDDEVKNNSFNAETAKKARLGSAEDRILLSSLIREADDDFVGWILINGVQYYCAGNRALLHSGFKLIDGEYYYFTPSGEALFMLTR